MWASAVPVCWLLSEAMWLYSVISLGAVFRGNPDSPLSLGAVLLLLGAAYVVARLLEDTGMSLGRIRLLQVAVWMAITYLAMMAQLAPDPLKPDLAWPLHLGSGEDDRQAFYRLLSIAAAAAVWWRGLRLAAQVSLADALERSFKVGSIVVSAAAVAHTLARTAVPLLLVALVFFGVTLLGLALVRVQEGRIEMGAGRPWWYRLVIGVVAGVLLVGVGLAALSGGPINAGLSTALDTLSSVARLLFLIVMTPVFFAVYYLLGLVWALWRSLFGGLKELPEIRIDFLRPDELVKEEARRNGLIPELLLQLIQWTLVIAAAAAVLWLLARAFRRRERLSEEVEVERESLWEGLSNVGEDLRALLAGLIPAWRPVARPVPPSPPDWTKDARTVVEGLYRWFSYRAALAGVARQPHETPLEFQRRLAAMFPEEPVAVLTRLFNLVRYGGRLPVPEDFTRLRELWSGPVSPAQS